MTIDTNQPCVEDIERQLLADSYGGVWNTRELQEHFTVLGFSAPLAHVIRKSDGVEGSVMFQHSPRFYFAFVPGSK
jgi:hypothetical protein